MRLTGKMGKRIMTMLLICVMTAMCLTACGKGEDWRSKEDRKSTRLNSSHIH